MTQLLSPPSVARGYTPNERFPAMRSVRATTSTYTTQRILGLWVPGEMFRRGTTFIIEAHSITTAATVVNFNIGGRGTSRALGVNIALTAADAVSTVNVARVMFIQESDGLIPTIRLAGSWNGDGGNSDGSAMMVTSSTAVFIQPLNFVEISTNGTFPISFASLEVIPGPGPLRNAETFDV